MKGAGPLRTPFPVIGLLACLWIMGCGPKAQHTPDQYANEAARYEAYRIADLFGIAAEHYYSHHGTLPVEPGAIVKAFAEYCDEKIVVDGTKLKITSQIIGSNEVKAPFKKVKVSVEYLNECQTIVSELLLAKPEEATGVYWIWRDENQVLVETEDNLADMLAIMSLAYKEDNGKWPKSVHDLKRHTWYATFVACGSSNQLSLDVPDRLTNEIIVKSKTRRYIYDENAIDKSLPPRIELLKMAVAD